MQIVDAKGKISQASTSTLNDTTTQYNVVYNKESQVSNQMEGIEPTGGNYYYSV